MAGSPQLKIFNSLGEYIGCVKHYEDAACLVSSYGAGATVRYGHNKKNTLWTEGAEDFSAGDSGPCRHRNARARRCHVGRGKIPSGDQNPMKAAICKALCKSGKFETGQGTCAPICMENFGYVRKGGCSHADKVHDKLASSILAALSTPLSPVLAARQDALEAVADAIDEARYQYPDHPRARPRAFSEADRSDREYALRLARAALRLAAAPGGEPVQDTWFTDSNLPIMAMSGDHESDRVLKLHFRRKVTDADRKRLIEVLNAGENVLDPPPSDERAKVVEDRISFPRWWITQIRDQLMAAKLPSGALGDWAFLFREQLNDALAPPKDAAGTEKGNG